MENNYVLALLLLSIFENENNKGAELENIIAYADFINHAIMSFDEFNNGVNYLLTNGLIKEVDKRLFVENSFKEWFNKKYKNNKRIYPLVIIEKIQKHFNEIQKNNNANEKMETKISKIEFENCVNEYIK